MTSNPTSDGVEEEAIPRVFLDTNFLVAAVYAPNGDWNSVLVKRLHTYVTSEHILEELERNLVRLGTDPRPFITVLRSFFEVSDQFAVLPAGLPVPGSGDRQALAEAIGANCDLFVSSDSDFSALFGQKINGVLVENGAVYVRRLLSNGERSG